MSSKIKNVSIWILIILQILSVLQIIILGVFGFILDIVGHGPVERFLLKFNMPIHYTASYIIFIVSFIVLILSILMRKKLEKR
jgi:hypothetical protein